MITPLEKVEWKTDLEAIAEVTRHYQASLLEQGFEPEMADSLTRQWHAIFLAEIVSERANGF